VQREDPVSTLVTALDGAQTRLVYQGTTSEKDSTLARFSTAGV
jgi:hypothetical protein